MRNGKLLVAKTVDASRPHLLMRRSLGRVPDEPAMILMFRPMAACVSGAPDACAMNTMFGSVMILPTTEVPAGRTGVSRRRGKRPT